MQYFQDYESYEIEFKLLQCNENASSFIDFVVNKIKTSKSYEDAKNIVEKVLKKAFEVKKSVLPIIITSLLTVVPLSQIISESSSLDFNQKEHLNAIIEKNAEWKRISEIDDHFLEILAQKESSNDWTNCNNYGYIGKYQIGEIAFQDIYKDIKIAYFSKLKGSRKEKIKKLISDFTKISHNKKLNQTEKEKALNKIFPLAEQEKAMQAIIKKNKHYLRKYRSYIGKEINGIKMTWSGMIAAAHLKGAKSVKIYLDSDGKNIPKDYFGTSVEAYMKLFK